MTHLQPRQGLVGAHTQPLPRILHIPFLPAAICQSVSSGRPSGEHAACAGWRTAAAAAAAAGAGEGAQAGEAFLQSKKGAWGPLWWLDVHGHTVLLVNNKPDGAVDANRLLCCGASSPFCPGHGTHSVLLPTVPPYRLPSTAARR